MIRAEGSLQKVYGLVNVMMTKYQAEITAIVDALDRFTRPAQITMHIDDWIATNVRDGHLERWQGNGWMTTRGTTVENKDYWQRLYNKMRVFKQAGGSFDFERLEEAEERKVIEYINAKKEQDE